MRRTIILFYFICTVWQGNSQFNLSGTTFTLTGGSAGSRYTPQDLINLNNSNAVKGGDRTIIIKNGYDLLINGFYDDSGWHYEMSSGSRMMKDSNCDWVSGSEYHGVKINGASWSIDGLGHSWDFNLGDGGRVYWRDVVMNVRTAARSDFRIYDDTSTMYDIDGFKYNASLGAQENSTITFDVGVIKNVQMIRTHMGTGGNGTLTNLTHIGLFEAGAENKIFRSADNLHLVNYQPSITSDGVRIATAFNNFTTSDGEKTIYFDDLVVPDFFDHTTDIVVYSGPGRIIGQRTFDVKLNDNLGNALTGVRVVIKNTADNTNSVNSLFNNEINQLITVYDGEKSTNSSAYTIPDIIKDYQNKNAYFLKYDRGISSILGINMRANKYESRIFMLEDVNISEANSLTVDAYTTIANLDQFYDRAKSWKMELANLEYPAIDELVINGNGTELDLGNRNLVIDATAASAFAVDKNTHTITIKSTALAVGSKFSTIKTTGTITLQNGATLEAGFIDTTGTYVYMELTNLDQQDLLVTDQQNPGSPVTILSLANQSGIYKTHITLPVGGEINVLVERDGYAPWTETIPNGELNFIREVNTSLSSITGANQILTIDLLIKLLQKTEAVLNSVNVEALPVPAVNVTTNTTAATGPPSVDNQNVEIGILRSILMKMTAVRKAIEGE